MPIQHSRTPSKDLRRAISHQFNSADDASYSAWLTRGQLVKNLEILSLSLYVCVFVFTPIGLMSNMMSTPVSSGVAGCNLSTLDELAFEEAAGFCLAPMPKLQ